MTVAEIEAMDRAALVTAWSEVFRTPVPKGLSKALMRRFLAVEIQTRRMGGLSKKTKAALQKAPDHAVRPQSRVLQPGGRLLREWNGVTHVVDVTDDGFLWKDVKYRSLSKIAREITGAHWSGPRFFGLTGVTKS
ncbi:DUF2924 domain-containing protein [Ruegeria sp. THAF33]|uniref:DUF2924 domain-containing protein n=1 Tax=Ruegeria sp. THAF33 TaxID=2587853 RepID=UPI001267DEC5|nr:DUF2924 domain-containing protein [Ruegeria sp. THAF33]QFT71765.1 hypothetical protein FIU92_01880 [Ruegeria sp. THAF33]